MAEHNILGKKGEELAVNFLEKNGYTIQATNYRYQRAEIDIIAIKDNTLAVIEVKTRSSTHFGSPESFVNQKKIQLLVQAINQYIQKNKVAQNIRFDIITVVVQGENYQIEHLTDAFYYF